MEEELRDAAEEGDLARRRTVLATGVDVDARPSNGCTALHLAARYGRAACLEALLAAGASVHQSNVIGVTPLHAASIDGHVPCVRALLAAGADVNHAMRWTDGTPFSYALAWGHPRVLKILLRAGANVQTENAERDEDNTYVWLVERDEDNTNAWLLVDAIQKVGGWPQYVHRRRETFASVVKMVTWNKLPDAVNLEIAAFIEPPGGY